MSHKIFIDTDKCIGCGLCVKDCASANLYLDGKKARKLTDGCILCGHCVAVCPKSAVSISGYAIEPSPKENDVRLDPDEVLDVIRFRRSIRHFKDKRVPAEIVEKIIEAGNLTHTAKNLRDVTFTVIGDGIAEVERIAVRTFRKLKPFANIVSPLARRIEITDDFFFFGAPLVILVSAKDEINGILASQNMEFVAEAFGLGVLFSGFFTTCVNISGKLKRKLDIPKGSKAAAALVIGYPDIKYARSVPRDPAVVKYI